MTPVLIPEVKIKELIREDGKRIDGRALDELRTFSCKIGILNNAKGSAFVQHGGNQIIAGVYGPREVHPRHLAQSDRGILRIYYRMSTFSVNERASPAPNRRAHEISKVIEDAITPILFLELYPDSQIEVYVQVMAADGGTRCASTTAVSLALADAGIPMKSLVCGVAAGKINGKVILDCGDEEDKAGDADMPCAVVMKDKSISLLQFDGQMKPDEMELAFKYVQNGAEKIFEKMVDAIKTKFKKVQDEASVETKKIDDIKEKEAEKTQLETDKKKEESAPKAEEKKEEPKVEPKDKPEGGDDKK